MRIPLSWLKKYVDVDLSALELANRLTMAGIEVGDIDEIGGWPNCVVAQVLFVSPHPNADRLSICRISTGDEELEVICGAPNVAANQKVCFAKVGAFIYNSNNGLQETLKPARIRGVISQGMLCSEAELGLGEDQSGIVVLPDDATLGIPLDQYFGDTILVLDVTPNRLDCFSILGVAREVAALTGNKVREPEVKYLEEGPPITNRISVSVADPDLCHRYTASLILGVKVEASPRWLQDLLIRAGTRPINNVVDVTNYVMLEYNQPLHAFDVDKLEGKAIIVRRAKPGESLVTLDGVSRNLNQEVLVIADAHNPVAIGGVMGGARSEISPLTSDIFLESATFNSYNNRVTAESFRLRTEATIRFEKGLNPQLAPIALRRATQLIHMLAGGQIANGIFDIFPDRDAPTPTVTLTLRRLKKVLGMELDSKSVESVLKALDLHYQQENAGVFQVEIPYWRNDINIEDDLVEEIVRIIGYDAVPTTMLATPIPHHQPAPMTLLRERIEDVLVGTGTQEVITYPLISLEALRKINQYNEANLPLKIANPLSADREYLRPTLRVSLLATLADNWRRSDGPFRLFEIGRVFIHRPDDLPLEREVLTGVMAGRRWTSSWLTDESHMDFYDAKGVVCTVLDKLGISADFQPSDDPSFYPGRCARIMAEHNFLGMIGELHPDVRERIDLKPQPIALYELYLDELLRLLPQSYRRFRPLSKFPAATRDLALVVPSDIQASKVQDLIADHRLVEHVELFDVYTGENVPAGTKSLAFHAYFQLDERTLTTKEINDSLQSLLRKLNRKLGASLRS
jgi:phenylalanyl-tRNA synthetase beta chain